MSNKSKNGNTDLAKDLRRIKKQAKIDVANLQAKLNNTTVQLQDSERNLADSATIFQSRNAFALNLIGRLGSASRLMFDMQNKLIDSDTRNKAILDIIAKVASTKVTIPRMIQILTRLGTTAPNELIEAFSATIPPEQQPDLAPCVSNDLDKEALIRLLGGLDDKTGETIVWYLAQGLKIKAIIELRRSTQCSIQDGKHAIELMQDTLRNLNR